MEQRRTAAGTGAFDIDDLGPQRPNGPIAAVLLATGIGSLALGLVTSLAEASEGVHDWLEFDDGVGPLSGKTIVAVIVFVVAWGGLHIALRARELPWRTEFGSLLHLLRHQRSAAVLEELARVYVVDALKRWEPRVVVTAVPLPIAAQ